MCTYEEGDFFWFMQGPELPSGISCNFFCVSYLIEFKFDISGGVVVEKEVRGTGVKEDNTLYSPFACPLYLISYSHYFLSSTLNYHQNNMGI